MEMEEKNRWTCMRAGSISEEHNVVELFRMRHRGFDNSSRPANGTTPHSTAPYTNALRLRVYSVGQELPRQQYLDNTLLDHGCFYGHIRSISDSTAGQDVGS